MSFSRILVNSTYATAHAEPLVDRHGADVLSVVAKLALSFDRAGRLGLSVRNVRMHDQPDGTGGVRFPSDLEAEKVGTDVALVGSVVPAEGRGLSQANVWLRVGPLGKAAVVHGPRTYVPTRHGPAPGPAAPLERTPLVPALAYGGVDLATQQPTSEPFNPVGRGHAAVPETLLGRPAPQIEPAALLDVKASTEERASVIARAQAAFAPIAPQWEPRRSRGGTRDRTWSRTRAPVAPTDFDPRSASWAPVGLHSEAPLRGDEAVELGGFRPGAPVRFQLPGFAPRFRSVEQGTEREHASTLDGIIIDVDDGVLELVWRSSIPLPLKWARLERVDVLTARPLPREIVERPQMRGS